MSVPVIEKIAVAVVDRLNGVKATAGYNVTLRAERKTKRGHVPKDMLAIVEQGGADVVEDEAEGWAGFTETFNVWIYSVDSERSDTPIDRRLNIAAADVEKAVMSDPQWSNLAINTTLSGRDPIDEVKGDFAGIVVRFAVYYRTLENDPYNTAL